MKTKQRSQATTVENLSSETSCQIHTILIEGTECIHFENNSGGFSPKKNQYFEDTQYNMNYDFIKFL